jgi:hypothetical protein
VIRIKPSFISDILFITICFFACNARQENVAIGSEAKPKKVFTLLSPALDFVCNIDDSLHFEIGTSLKDYRIDSSVVYISGEEAGTEMISPLTFYKKNLFTRVGRQNIRLVLYFNDTLTQTLSTRITVLSDIEPVPLRYTVVRSLPHTSDV